MRIINAVILALVVCLGAHAQKLFDVELKDQRGAGRMLNVSFYGKVPPPAVVDKILRQSLEHAVALDSSKEILATAFLGDDALNSNQSSGSLVYRLSDKKNVTMDEFKGAKPTQVTSAAGYSVITEEKKTLVGIKPERRWLSIDLVFAKAPADDAAYAAVIEETGKAMKRGLDIDISVSFGDAKVKTSVKQIKDSRGTYIGGEYSTSTRKLIGNGANGKLLRQF